MKTEQIIEVIDKLVGSIEPAGASHIDGKRTENLKTYIEIFDKMHTKIDNIAYYNKDSHEASIVKWLNCAMIN